MYRQTAKIHQPGTQGGLHSRINFAFFLTFVIGFERQKNPKLALLYQLRLCGQARDKRVLPFAFGRGPLLVCFLFRGDCCGFSSLCGGQLRCLTFLLGLLSRFALGGTGAPGRHYRGPSLSALGCCGVLRDGPSSLQERLLGLALAGAVGRLAQLPLEPLGPGALLAQLVLEPGDALALQAVAAFSAFAALFILERGLC